MAEEGLHGKHCAIAIDGPAASGKSTVARELAERLGVNMVNTGAMYRTLAWEAVRRGLDLHDQEAVAAMAGGVRVECGVAGGQSTITINGEDPGEALRSAEVNAAVSAVSAVPAVRTLLVACQRDLLRFGDLVMEGRDIGSVVFPDTPYKFYIDASEEVRMKRRRAEGQEDAVAQRDRQDSQRKTSPLVVAEGAHVIDSSELAIEDVVAAVLARLRTQGWFERQGEPRTP